MPFRFFYLYLVILIVGCNKVVQVGEPINSITTSETFSNPNNANAAITAIYNDMSFGGGLAGGTMTIDAGMSADELIPFGSGNNPFYRNNILSKNGDVLGIFWAVPYYEIYMANAAIEGLNASTTLSSTIKQQLSGEAKFLRALDYFYLVNLFGDVPLVTSASWANSSLAKREASVKVYQQIVSDLNDAQSELPKTYISAGGDRTRANYWCALALLSRVYLYIGNNKQVDSIATIVINNSTDYSLVSDLNAVFLQNSQEAILQFQNVDNGSYQYATLEGNSFIPYDDNTSPTYILTDQLLGAMEPGDKRKTAWVDSFDNGGTYLYYPYKYKVRATTPDNITEYYTVLRLAEQYLIRAEARANLDNLDGSIGDLNTIRVRAGLSPLPPSLSKTEVLAAIAQERRIELFAEWGHRWLDLKRTKQIDVVMDSNKPWWKPSAALYPIPLSELQTDPNLTQNPGY